MLPSVRIKGSIGRWTAEAGEDTLPVLHSTWWNVASGDYCDPMTNVRLDGARYADYVARLRACERAIIQKDRDPATLRRGGYLGVFSFSDLNILQNGAIRLRIVERIANPKT